MILERGQLIRQHDAADTRADPVDRAHEVAGMEQRRHAGRAEYDSDTAGNTGRLPCKGSDFRAIRYLLRLNLGIKKHDLVKSRVFIKLAALHPARCLRNSRNRSSISLSLLNLLRYGANRFRSKLSFFGGAAARCVAFDRASRHAA